MNFVGHRDPDTGREQSLAEHSRHTAVLCARFCAVIGLEKLGYLTGLLHDAGKASCAFQKYIRELTQNLKGKINHSFCGAQWFSEEFGIDKTAKGLASQLAALAVCGHHSGLPDCLAPNGEDELTARIYPEKGQDYPSVIQAFIKDCCQDGELEMLMEEAAGELKSFLTNIVNFCGKLPKHSDMTQRNLFLAFTARYLESALVDADRCDTRLFYEGKEIAFEEPDLPEWERLAGKLERKLADFQSDSPINIARREISDLCLKFAQQGPEIYQLNVPTGSGKTLASLRYALHTAAKNKFRRIFYVAPYKSILDQNANAVRKNLDEPELILEHHGDAIPDASEEEYNKYVLLTERWDSPIVLTTMVQFLNTLFLGKNNSVRRFHSLAQSVIILDEVQSIPSKFVSLFNCALNYLSAICGCAVILCTATQPALEQVPHPVYLGTPSEMVPILPSFRAFERTEIKDLTIRPPMDRFETATLICKQQKQGNSVLAIFNTKTAARKVYEAVSKMKDENVSVYFLSTALCPAHRSERIEEIKRQLKEGIPVVCISTQLIEAGVDISFGCVIRSLAGLDSIAQSAGRCNRNGETPKGEVLIVKSAEEDLTHLPEIREEQRAAESTLEAVRRNPELYPGGILSREAIDFYYGKYYRSSKLLDGPVSAKQESRLPRDTTLIDLLGTNRVARSSLQEKQKDAPPRLLNQAFQTAGANVTVIENTGIDVLVPYGRGKELIAELGGSSFEKVGRLIRQCQRYLVHLYSYEQHILEDKKVLNALGETGVCALNPRFYSEQTGFVTDGELMENLLC